MGGGLYVRYNFKIADYADGDGLDTASQQLFVSAYLLAAVGVGIALISLFGALGVWKEIKVGIHFS